MKKKVMILLGFLILVSILLHQPVLADSENTSGTTPSTPIQVSPYPAAGGTTLPSTIPQNMSQITPPTSTNVNPNIPQPPNPGNINVNPVTIPGTNPPMTPPPGSPPITPGITASPSEAVLSNYSNRWFLSPWFISLIVLILVIALLVVYSFIEGRIPKEEKETDLSTANKKKKNKK